MVIGGQAGLFQAASLIVRKHAQSDTGLHPQGSNLTNHVQHLIELRAVPRAPPGGAHAEASRSKPSGMSRSLFNLLDVHQRSVRYTGGIAGALSAVGAVLGTATGLDAQESAALDVSNIVMAAVDFRRSKN